VIRLLRCWWSWFRIVAHRLNDIRCLEHPMTTITCTKPAPRAERRLAKRYPNDAAGLALALHASRIDRERVKVYVCGFCNYGDDKG
jgi:hypothetical protein